MLKKVPFQGEDGEEFALEFSNVPLSTVIARLRKATSLPIVIDRLELEDDGIELETPVSFSVQSVTLDYGLTVL